MNTNTPEIASVYADLQAVLDKLVAIDAAKIESAKPATSTPLSADVDNAVRGALREAIDVFEGMNDDEINVELLPRLKAALAPAEKAGGDLTPEQISIQDDMFEAWVGEPKYRGAFLNDCKRLIAATPAPPSDVARMREELIKIADCWAKSFGGLPSGEDVSEWITNTLIPELEEAVLAPTEKAGDDPETLIAKAPDVLKRLGERLTHLLDDDNWNNIEPMLLTLAKICAATPALRSAAHGGGTDDLCHCSWGCVGATNCRRTATKSDGVCLSSLPSGENEPLVTPASAPSDTVQEPEVWRHPKSGVNNGYYYFYNIDLVQDRFKHLYEPLYTRPVSLDREAVARIIDPRTFELRDKGSKFAAQYCEYAYEKADAIIAMIEGRT